MMRGLISLVVLAMVSLTGCSSGDQTADAQSRALATKLRQLTAAYQANTKTELDSEVNFYTQSTAELRRTLNVTDPTQIATDKSGDVTSTVAYGQIITQANSDAFALSATLVDGVPLASFSTDILAFIRHGVGAEATAFTDARALDAQAEKSLAADFSAVATYEKRTADIVSGLAELEKASANDVRLSQAQAIGTAIVNQLKTPSK
jgi:hypothetical protein